MHLTNQLERREPHKCKECLLTYNGMDQEHLPCLEVPNPYQQLKQWRPPTVRTLTDWTGPAPGSFSTSTIWINPSAILSAHRESHQRVGGGSRRYLEHFTLSLNPMRRSIDNPRPSLHPFTAIELPPTQALSSEPPPPMICTPALWRLIAFKPDPAMDTTEEGQVPLHTPDQPSEMGRREPIHEIWEDLNQNGQKLGLWWRRGRVNCWTTWELLWKRRGCHEVDLFRCIQCLSLGS